MLTRGCAIGLTGTLIMSNNTFKEGGYTFRTTYYDDVWEILEGKAIIKYTKHNMWKALGFLADNSRKGSIMGGYEITISVRRKKSRIIIKYREVREM